MKNQTPRYLVIVIALQSLILLGQWTGSTLPAAVAQVPDAGAQRNDILRELKALNDKSDKLYELLQSGKLVVQPAREAK